MSFILSTVLSYLLLYNYVALFVVGFLAAFFLPIPSDTAVLAAGAFASQGFLNIYLVLLVSLAGNIAGDLTGFFLARKYGKTLLLKIGFRRMIESARFAHFEKFIADNAGPTIYLSRFVGQIGPLVNILSGLSKMSWKKFFVYEAAGEFTDVVTLGLLGYFLGSSWQNLTLTLELIGGGFVVILAVFIFSRLYFRHRK